MRAIFINPFFVTKGNVIGFHTQSFIETIGDVVSNPIVFGIKDVDTCLFPHTYIPVKRISLRYINALITRVSYENNLLPDTYKREIKRRFVRKILKSIDFSEIDYIHSFSNPLTSNLIAYEIHKITNKPWIAQLYDPWTDSPYRMFKHECYKRKDEKLESLVAESATAIIHTNNIIRNKWKNRYGESIDKKSYVLPLTYPKSLYDNISSVKQKPHQETIIISYIGNLFFDRNLIDVIKAITLIKEEFYKYNKKIKIRVIGKVEQRDISMIKDYHCEDCFDIIPPQDRNKLIEYYNESDAFLLIESPQKENVFFPSKLLDYFYYQRPIIGITPLVGETTDLLNQSNNIAICNGDIPKLKDAFLRLMNDDFPLFDKNFYKHFSPELLKTQYENIVKTIIKQ